MNQEKQNIWAMANEKIYTDLFPSQSGGKKYDCLASVENEAFKPKLNKEKAYSDQIGIISICPPSMITIAILFWQSLSKQGNVTQD